MNLVRMAAFGAAAVLLGGGYLASQFAAFNGTAAQYAQSVDQPMIKYVSLVILLLCVALAAMRQEEPEA